MTCRECGAEVRELYSCRICDGNGLCAECAMLCEDDLPFTEFTESAENEPTEETWPQEPGDEQCADKFEQRDRAPLEKPRGHCVRIDGWDV